MRNDKEISQLVPKRPRSVREKIFGIVGGVATFAWIFPMCLRIIDAIGRVQILMALEPYTHYLVTWWVQLIELGAAVTFVVLATRIEHSRETEDAPKIILLETRKPTPIKRDWLWMKVTAGGGLFAAVVATIVFLAVRHNPAAQTAQTKMGPSVAPKAIPVPDNKPAGNAKLPSSQVKRSTIPVTAQDKPVNKSQASQPPPIVIPVPDRAVPKAATKSTVKYVAQIAGQVVEAKNKTPGMLTVALSTTSNSQYLGNITNANVNDVVEALKKTGKVSVLLNPSAGNYSINGNGLGYSMSITQIHARTIYFFDDRLESACAALSAIVSSIVGKMTCQIVSVQPPSDPNQPNIQYDFLVQSGLDMEIDL
jgi:hypothetical protein